MLNCKHHVYRDLKLKIEIESAIYANGTLNSPDESDPVSNDTAH